jgi:hypothetical protein
LPDRADLHHSPPPAEAAAQRPHLLQRDLSPSWPPAPRTSSQAYSHRAARRRRSESRRGLWRCPAGHPLRVGSTWPPLPETAVVSRCPRAARCPLHALPGAGPRGPPPMYALVRPPCPRRSSRTIETVQEMVRLLSRSHRKAGQVPVRGDFHLSLLALRGFVAASTIKRASSASPHLPCSRQPMPALQTGSPVMVPLSIAAQQWMQPRS